MKSSPLMTQAEYAARRGVGQSAVSNWKARSLLVFAEDPARPGKLLVNADLTDARLATHVDSTRGRPPTNAAQAQLPLAAAAPVPNQLSELRTDLLEEQTYRLRLQNAQAAGSLVPLEEYERRSSEFGRMARERMNAIARTLSERLAAETDPRQVTALLADEIDRAFGELADQLEAGAIDQAADDGLGLELDDADLAAEDDAE